MKSPSSPTLAIYTALQRAFDHFNAQLFGGKLPPCLITLRSSARAFGYLHKSRFVNLSGEHVDELGINPGYFALQSVEEVMATLVHEMVHHWQNHFGCTPEPSSHNREWADKMEEIGLTPSHTGLPGGKKTGRTMSDYIIPDGAFIKSCTSLIAKGFSLPWLDSHLPVAITQIDDRRKALAASGIATTGGEPPIAHAVENDIEFVDKNKAPKTKPSRVRMHCPKCAIHAWAPPGTSLYCGVCGKSLKESNHATRR